MNRVALYLSRPTAQPGMMIQCARAAAAEGERVVTAASEASSARCGHRPILKRLVQRMEAGEFDAIRLVRRERRDGSIRIAEVEQRP